jgi:integrase
VALHGHRPVASIGRSDISSMLDRVTATGVTVGANRKLAHTRRFFNWLVERGVLAASPVVGVKPPAKERSKNRVLSDEELSAVWRSAEVDDFPFGPLVQLLILTGQRRGEVSGVRWDEIDFQSRTWTLGADRTKGVAFTQSLCLRLPLRYCMSLPGRDRPARSSFRLRPHPTATGQSPDFVT